MTLIAAFLLHRARVAPGPKKEQVSLPAFYIDRTEVTNTAYFAFVNATHHALPPDFSRDPLEYPVVNVTVADAEAFAAWAEQRLPSALEWEKAAAGSDGRLFPWGNDAIPTRAKIGTNRLLLAERFAQWASPSKALQMAGNLAEFVDQGATPRGHALEYCRDNLKPPPTTTQLPLRAGSSIIR